MDCLADAESRPQRAHARAFLTRTLGTIPISAIRLQVLILRTSATFCEAERACRPCGRTILVGRHLDRSQA